MVFIFYTFIKKNAEATFKALMTNPDRVTRAARFYSNQPSLFSKKDERFASMPETDVARFVVGEMENEQGEDVMFSTSPMSVPEGLMMLYTIANIGTLGGVSRALDAAARSSGKANVTSPGLLDSMEELLGMVTPFPYMPSTFLYPYQVSSGASAPGMDLPLNKAYANKVPHYLMKPPIGQWVMRNLDPTWIPLEHGPGSYRPGDPTAGFYALEYDDRVPDAARKEDLMRITFWNGIKGALGGGQPLFTAQKYIDFIANNSSIPIADRLASERTGAGGFLDLATSVQRRVPLEGEAELDYYEDLLRQFEAGQKAANKRVNP